MRFPESWGVGESGQLTFGFQEITLKVTPTSSNSGINAVDLVSIGSFPIQLGNQIRNF